MPRLKTKEVARELRRGGALWDDGHQKRICLAHVIDHPTRRERHGYPPGYKLKGTTGKRYVPRRVLRTLRKIGLAPHVG